MDLHHLKTVPVLFLWLQNYRICVGEITVRSTTTPGITPTISSTAQTIIETDTSADVAASTVRRNTSTATEETSSTRLSSYVQDSSTAVFVEKFITQNPGHFYSSPDETTDEMTVTAEMTTIRNSLLTSLPSSRSPTEITADMTNPIGTPDEELFTSGATPFTSILPLEATAFASTLVDEVWDDTATSVEIISPATLSSDTPDKTTFTTEHFATLMHTVTGAKTNATTHIGTDSTQSLPLSIVSDAETAPAFSSITEDILTSFHSTMLPFETRVPTHILEDQDTAHTSEEVATSTSGVTDAPFSFLSTSPIVEMSSAFSTTMQTISTASLSSTSPLETKAITGILAHWSTTGPSEEVVGRTTENMSPGINSPVTISAVDTPSAFHTTEGVTSTALHSVISSPETTATTGILGDWDTTLGEASTTEDITAAFSSITTSDAVELLSNFHTTTEAISASPQFTMSSPETTATISFLADQVTTGTSSEVDPSTMGATTAAISSFNSSSVETPSTFSTTAETTSIALPFTTSLLETTATTGVLADKNTTSPSKSMTAITSFLFTSPTVETQFASSFSTDATTGFLSIVSPSKTAATTGFITDANTTHASGEATINIEGEMTASLSAMPTKQSSVALIFPAETTAEVSSNPAGNTVPVTQSSTSVSEALSAFSPSTETTWTAFPPTIALTETAATTGRAATATFSTSNLEEVASTPAEMTTSTAADESSPAQLFSHTPDKAATETGSPTTATLSSFPQAETTDETASTFGATSEATSTVFTLPMSPVEITTKASIATDSGTKNVSTTEGKTTSELPSANTSLVGRTVTAKLPTPSDTITSLSNSKPPARHDLGRIHFILSMSLTTSLNITDPAVRDAVVKKFHQDLYARFPDAGFSVTWIGQQQES